MSSPQEFEWEHITEYRENVYLDKTKKVEVKGVRLKNGFIVIYDAYGRDQPWEPDFFRCKGYFGEFKFSVRREYDRITRRMSPIASVHLITGAYTTDLELCRKHAKYIESAIFELSSAKLYYSDSPLEEVLFEIPTDKARKYIQAHQLNEIMFTRGFDEVEYSERNKSEWQLITEKRCYRSKKNRDEYYDVIGIRREDGFTVTLEGVDQNRTHIFLCSGPYGEMRFSTERWSTHYVDAVNSWFMCKLYWFSPKWLANLDGNYQLCQEHHSDIEAALLNFPMFKNFYNVPIENVELIIEKPLETVLRLVENE